MNNRALSLATLVSFTACMGPGTEPTEEAPSVTARALVSEAPVADVCRELMRRERDCSAVFIPALVAERVRRDIPAGIAATDAKIGREALVSEALDEYAEDSKDAVIDATCAGLARTLPADRAERLVPAGKSCLALDGCEPFVACAVPISIQP